MNWLSGDELAAALQKLLHCSLLALGDGVRLSLAGAMCKLTVFRQDDSFGIPTEMTPGTHIIKSGHPGFDEIVHNACFCARLAARAGLPAAKATVLEHAGDDFLLVERYDRRDGRRIHQEDFCQALGYPSREKISV